MTSAAAGDFGALRLRCGALAEALDLAAADEVADVRALHGGVASDIAVVELPGGPVCMKFALPRLKVAEAWHAPVHRNAAEYAWLEAAGRVVPDSVPTLYGRLRELHGFAMEYLDGADCRLWKAELLAGRVDGAAAAAVGRTLGRVHAASARSGFDTAPFRNRDDFHALRLEPYLHFTAKAHPALAAALRRLADALYAADGVLVHGDVSPKNILFRGDEPVLLDAECATMGDASFDVAFCLNHLALKSVHLPSARDALLDAMQAFRDAYAGWVDWEPVDALEARVCALLPALMLARVDGKSPVEYLSEAERCRVRVIAATLLGRPPANLATLSDALVRVPPGDRP